MKRIAYLLHQFPRVTDTFIMREVRCLQRCGTNIQVISVWKPHENESTPGIMAHWSKDTQFVLPRSAASIACSLFMSIVRSPGRFLCVFYLALSTSRPGIRGLIYQLFYFVEAVLVAEVMQKSNIDHVHNHFGDQSGTVTMLAARLAGIGYSISFHGPHIFFDPKYSSIKEKVLGAMFVRAISYFCRSQLMLFSECNDPSLFKIIHCGLSIERYDYRPPRKPVKRLFCAARLAPEKGIALLIHALKLLLARGYELELRLAGDGPSKRQLEIMTAELGLSAHISFLGYLGEDEVICELQAADIFVLPSLAEGIPVSAMEAMAVGVPVIATNIAGMSELIENGKTGLLVRPSDPEALADAVVAMIEDYSFRQRVAELGRKKVVDEFDIEKETIKVKACLLRSCGIVDAEGSRL